MKRFQTFSRALLLAILIPAFSVSAQEVNRTYDVSPGGILRLDLETGGTITITGWNRNEVEVNISVSGRDGSDVIVDLEEIRNGVAIATEYEGRNGRADLEIDIRVPFIFNLDIETSGGDVQIENVEGEIKGQTMGGDLEFDNIKGEIDFSTMGGDISLENSIVDGSVETMGGEVYLENVVGNVNGHTMGGEVTYENVRANPNSRNKELEITTMGGEINLDQAAYGATLHTMGGDINVGSVAHHIKATTMGGDITIEEIDGWVEATTMGGDVDVVVVGDPDSGDRHIEISSMGGDIDLVVPAGMDMKFDLEIRFDGNRNSDRYQIRSDFDIDVQRQDNNRGDWSITASGTVGSGTHRVKITTHSGNITIRKGR
ncbi:MAG: hypothetical protein E2O84_05860 [Bacteroidetes bacterium]|nr:MAG: hypothetical protein E2O84_05860 [Bacteroidota bacterium]